MNFYDRIPFTDRRFWNGLSAHAWRELSDQIWEETLAGKRTLVLPETFYTVDTDYGRFIEIQRSSTLSDEPAVFIRDCHYGPALKVMIPKHAKAGNTICITRKSQSGKSYIAEIIS